MVHVVKSTQSYDKGILYLCLVGRQEAVPMIIKVGLQYHNLGTTRTALKHIKSIIARLEEFIFKVSLSLSV